MGLHNANAKLLITSDFPTPDEMAAELGIPDERVVELRRLIREIDAERPRRTNIRRSVKQVAKASARKK